MSGIVVITIFVVALVLMFGLWDQRQKVITRVAHNFGGRVVPTGWYSEVQLPIAHRPATLSFVKVGKGRMNTRLSIAWPDSRLRCEVYPRGIFSSLRKLFGVEDIEIDSPRFDVAYIVTGNNRAAIRELLNPAVQSLIMRLAHMKPPHYFNSGNIYVRWAGGELTVTKPHDLSTYESLEEFIGLTSELVMRALVAPEQGIQFVGEVERAPTKSQCQVCGEALVADLVYCASCRTAHHRECWEYFGGCSTYACGQSKYLTSGTPPS